jgi:hypothetical protein
MKKLLAMLMIVVMASVVADAQSQKTVKLLFKDYGLTNQEEGMGYLSVGACSWTDDENDFAVCGYWDVKLLMLWEEKLNLGAGMAIRPYHSLTFDKLAIDPRVMTSVTTHLFNHLELGVYYAPFWGLTKYSDPYGVMAGYYWKF